MIYTYAHKPDNRQNELCENCRWRKLCNEKNKTYAPLLTACGCTITMAEMASKDVVQKGLNVTLEENPLRKSQNFAYLHLMLKRLFCSDILCDTPHCNDDMRNAIKKWLGAYYGKETLAELEEMPNAKPQTLANNFHGVPTSCSKPLDSNKSQELGLFI